MYANSSYNCPCIGATGSHDVRKVHFFMIWTLSPQKKKKKKKSWLQAWLLTPLNPFAHGLMISDRYHTTEYTWYYSPFVCNGITVHISIQKDLSKTPGQKLNGTLKFETNFKLILQSNLIFHCYYHMEQQSSIREIHSKILFGCF